MQLFAEKFSLHYALFAAGDEAGAAAPGAGEGGDETARLQGLAAQNQQRAGLRHGAPNTNDLGTRTIAGVNNFARRAFDAIFLAGLGERPLPFMNGHNPAGRGPADGRAAAPPAPNPAPPQIPQGGLFGAPLPAAEGGAADDDVFRGAGAARGTAVRGADEDGLAPTFPPVLVVLQDKFDELV